MIDHDPLKYGPPGPEIGQRDGISGDLMEAIGDLSDAGARAYDALGKRTPRDLAAAVRDASAAVDAAAKILSAYLNPGP